MYLAREKINEKVHYFLRESFEAKGRLHLAREKINEKVHYFLRESFEAKGRLQSRDLFYLGTNPTSYIIYPGRNSFYINEQILDSLKTRGVKVVYDEIEKLFLPFLLPEIRHIYEQFSSRKSKSSISKLSKRDEERIRSVTHSFDKRRLHYLKFHNADQTMIRRVNQKCFRVLLDKSRDEIEQLIMEREGHLKPLELKSYVFAVFDLQRFFSHTYASTMPQALDQEKVDEYFLKEICKLNRDRYLWNDPEENNVLHRYLTRYIVMYFDNRYGPGSYFDDYLHDFMNRRRSFKYPTGQKSMRLDDVSVAFEMKQEELLRMNERQLTRLYRKKAKELHPDLGGDHDKFVKLTEAFNTLMLKKNR